MIDTDAIVAQYNLRQYIARELLNPEIETTHHSQWHCVFHSDIDSPSLTVYHDHYYCFGCEAHGDIIDWVQHRDNIDFIEACKVLGAGEPTSKEEITRRREEHAQRLIEIATQKREEAEKLISEAHWLEQYAGDLLNHIPAQEYLINRGINYSWAEHFGLGVKPRTQWGGDAISIPWPHKHNPRDLQYRGLNQVWRYRWEPKVPHTKSIFNGSIIPNHRGPLIMVEGAFKAMTLCVNRIDAVAIENKGGFREEWVPKLQGKQWYICLDPDAEQEAENIARSLRGKVIDLPYKVDDMVMDGTLTLTDFLDLIRFARPVD